MWRKQKGKTDGEETKTENNINRRERMQFKGSAAAKGNHENAGNYGNTPLHDPPPHSHTHIHTTQPNPNAPPESGGLQTFWSRQEFGLRYCGGVLGYK